MRRLVLKRHAILLFAIAVLIPSGRSEARIDPLRYLTDQVVRPEIIFVVDTSGSMRATISGSGWTGNDCSGHESEIDICGDKMCTGHERWAPVSCSSNADCTEYSQNLTCTGGQCKRGDGGAICADCKIFDERSSHAGSGEQCRFESTSTPAMDRMFLAKRAMRNVMSEFRGVANFALVTFGQTGYYRYRRADTVQGTVDTAIFLQEWELRSTGSWTQGQGWDNSAKTPKSAFSLGPSASTLVTYSLLSVAGVGDSLYRAEEATPLSAAVSGDWKGGGGCTSASPCQAGQGDCNSDTDCAPGLICGTDNANTVWGTGPWNSTHDVCVPDPIGSWVYQPKNSTKFIYKRKNWADWDRIHDDGTYKWEYQGSYYTYPAHHINKQTATGSGTWDWNGCSSSSRCGVGQGDCDNDGECQSGLTCIHDKAHLYNSAWPTNGDVCDVVQQHTSSTFHGPEYYDASGNLWVHNRFGGSAGGDAFNVYGQSSGNLKVGLVPATRATPQSLFDENLGKIMNHMNESRVGGLFASGGTPTCKAIDRAYTHLQHRRDGTGDGFTAVDEARDCRPRFVIVLSDGDSNSGCNTTSVRASAKKLYDDFGVTAIGMSIPGSSSGGISEMNDVSDCGDDGDCNNNSSQAVLSNTEKELVDNLRSVIFEAIKGNYTTAPSGVTWSGQSGVEGDVSVTPSTEFPGWRGRLEAKDLLQDPPQTLWSAGSLLDTRDWKSRLIFSGTHASGSPAGTPFRLFDGSGAVSTTEILAVWPTTPKPTAAQVTGFIQWLGGKSRDWKLPPIVRSVPASIGPPPAYSGLGDHSNFESSHALRQRLIYVTSNEGLIHAFDARGGNEVWAFMPPHLMPAAYDLYINGGQSEDPREFKYVMASSPRVDDVKIGGVWRTLLVQNDGPGGEDFVALDVSDMPTCTDAVPPTCTSPVSDAKPKVLFSSRYASPIIDGNLGETWSVPAIYWTGTLAPRVSMGTGYEGSATDDNQYYNFFTLLTRPWSTSGSGTPAEYATSKHDHASGSASVDYATLADTVAVVDPTNLSEVKVTYQADLLGRVWAYDLGKADTVRKIINLSHKEPIHFSPAAVYQDATGHVMLAFATGAYQDDDIKYVTATNSMEMQEGPGGTFKTKFYIYEDDFTGSATSKWELEATDICTLSQTSDFATNCNGGPCTCSTPSNRAMVVASPIIARNIKFGDRVEAFFVLYDPPAQICSNGNSCVTTADCSSWEACRGGTCRSIGIGDSFIYRVVIDSATGTAQLAQAYKHENVQASGLTVVGGGSDVTLSVSGRGSAKAGVQTLSGEKLADKISPGGRASVERWKEAR